MLSQRQIPVFIVGLLAFAAFLRVDFVFYIAYVLTGIYLFNWWFTPRLLRGIQVKREYAHNAFLGETIPVKVHLENPSRIPLPWIQLQEMTALNLRSGSNLSSAISLAGREQMTLDYQMRAMRRGYYRVGPLRLQAGDVFGMAETKGELAAEYLTVYPRILPIAKLGLPSRLPFGTIASKQRLYADPARPMGVRNFRSGDSMRQINWKASARLSQSVGSNLLVKTLEPAISLETMLLLDLDDETYARNTRYETSEWAVTVAASVAAHLTNKRQPVGLATNGYDPLGDGAEFDEGTGRLREQLDNSVSDDKAVIQSGNLIAPRNGRPHLMRVLELLARIESKRTQLHFADFATRATLHLNWGTTIVVISPSGDERMTSTLHRLLRAGYIPVLLIVQRTNSFGAIRERCRQLGFQAYYVADESGLGQVQS